jgi:hypothetical protein
MVVEMTNPSKKGQGKEDHFKNHDWSQEISKERWNSSRCAVINSGKGVGADLNFVSARGSRADCNIAHTGYL